MYSIRRVKMAIPEINQIFVADYASMLICAIEILIIIIIIM